MTTKKEEHDAPAVKDAEPVGSPEMSSPAAPRQPGTPPDPSSPKTPGTPSREPRGERPDEVKIALLDVNRNEISREMIPATEAGFRILIRGTAWERVGTTEDGIPSYALTS